MGLLRLRVRTEYDSWVKQVAAKNTLQKCELPASSSSG